MLFVVSLYFTFIKEKKLPQLSQSEISEIANIETGNIEYTTPPKQTIQTTTTGGTIHPLSAEQQTIVDFYSAVNALDISTMYKMVDTPLTQSNVFKTYYSKNWLSKFSETTNPQKIVVTNIQEVQTTSTNPNVKKYSYTIEYILSATNQKFTEERSTLLIKKNDSWKIGKLLCEIK
ncbi:MAG: hypothetical protein WCH65_01800 [bacterium]